MDTEAIIKDFSWLKSKVKAILLFGSYVEGGAHSHSDIDICIVAPNNSPQKIMREIWTKINVEKKDYDVWVFEDVSLKLKHRIMENHRILWKHPEFRLEEYFYKYKKLWEDQSVARGIT